MATNFFGGGFFGGGFFGGVSAPAAAGRTWGPIGFLRKRKTYSEKALKWEYFAGVRRKDRELRRLSRWMGKGMFFQDL